MSNLSDEKIRGKNDGNEEEEDEKISDFIVKVILIGDGNSGKTVLSKGGKDFFKENEKTTEGIVISKFEEKNKNEKYKLLI
jgi:GTPase SAR1 family protein